MPLVSPPHRTPHTHQPPLSSPPPSPPPAPPKKHRDELRIIDKIGEGAEGCVWRARFHHADVAVKEMKATTLSSFSRLTSIRKGGSTSNEIDLSQQDEEVLQAVLKEVCTLMDLTNHPKIVRYIGECVAAVGLGDLLGGKGGEGKGKAGGSRACVGSSFGGKGSAGGEGGPQGGVHAHGLDKPPQDRALHR